MTDIDEAARMAAMAGVGGGITRVLVALHGGMRGWQMLLLEAALGVTLGIMAAALCVWLDPGLRHDGWPLLIVPGAAGAAGAIGARVLDLAVDALKRRLG